MAQASSSTSNVGKIVNIALPLFLLALLIALCVQLLLPFVGLLVWTIILAICFKPLHDRLMNKRGMSSRRAAVVIGVGLSALVLVPTGIAAFSAASSIRNWSLRFKPGTAKCRRRQRG